MCPWALSCRRQYQPGFGVIRLSLSIEFRFLLDFVLTLPINIGIAISLGAP